MLILTQMAPHTYMSCTVIPTVALNLRVRNLRVRNPQVAIISPQVVILSPQVTASGPQVVLFRSQSRSQIINLFSLAYIAFGVDFPLMWEWEECSLIVCGSTKFHPPIMPLKRTLIVHPSLAVYIAIFEY